MLNNKLSLSLVVVLLGFLVFTCNGGVPRHFYMEKSKLNANEDKEVCLAQINASDEKLQRYLDYACSKYDCKAIQPGGVCFYPDNVFSHASYALDLEYKSTGTCNAELGTILTIDPSTSNCPLPRVTSEVVDVPKQ